MTKLRINGFNLSLDDFGTCYSTIPEIDALPFNGIKINKQFIHSMHDKNLYGDCIGNNSVGQSTRF
jgi:EAL domain-containing protein (putative c-di-GMP-specific phosphodiesterase class I)